MHDVARITGPTRTDSATVAESCLAGLLSFVFGDLHARRLLGLKAASRRADGWPAWYVWTAGSPGAHELALVPPGPAPSSDASLEFAIRYFPSPDEALFPRFAPVERSTRTSAAFDCTGTPSIQAMAELEPSLFHVGTLAMRVVDGGGVDIHLETQDEWREVVATHTGDVSRRAVPGTELSRPILDLVVLAHALVGRRAPRRVEGRRRHGVAWRIADDGAAVPLIMTGSSHWTISVLGVPRFGVPFTAAATGDLSGEDADDLAFSYTGEGPAPSAPPFDVGGWWAVAETELPPSGRICGCHVPHHDVVPDAHHRRLRPPRSAGAAP